MFDLETLTKMGLTGWPLVAAIAVVSVCFVSLWIGWPWDGIIQKNYNCDCTCKSCAGEDEE